MLKIKRVYEPATKDDGYRILVDRVWPRGVAKERAQLDLWMREVAPSDALRKWFSHDPRRWESFKRKYRGELRGKKALLQEIKQAEKEKGKVTLLYSAKDELHNQAVALKQILGNS